MLIILVGSSCANRATIEKKLVGLGFIPLNIFTTKSVNENDPQWIKHIGEHYEPDRHNDSPNGMKRYGESNVLFLKIDDMNGKKHYIKCGISKNARYITSIIDIKHARKLASIHCGKVRIIQLVKKDEDILKCLSEMRIPIEEVWDRYQQYLEIQNLKDIYTIDSDKAVKVINSLHI